MHDIGTTANLLGAAALAVNDMALGNATRAAGLSTSGAAALVSLSASPDISVTELGRRVGLTQSAAARMVDSLEADGLVERFPHRFNKRWVTLRMPPLGHATTHHILGARGEPLSDIVARLDEDDQQALADLLVKLLTHLYEHTGNAQYLCRLCDRTSCGTTHSTCPVGEAERRSQERADGPRAAVGSFSLDSGDEPQQSRQQ
jgi:MarR family transcriptional regulator, negative regulator of the multidrug operon emrRAB